MSRTFIQFTSMCLVIVSAFFLLKGNLGLSAKDIAKLSKGGLAIAIPYNEDVAGTLAQQQADTKVGFGVLLFSFLFQLVNAFWEMRWKDFAVNKIGFVIALIFSFLILLSGLYVSDVLRDGTLKEVARIYQKG